MVLWRRKSDDISAPQLPILFREMKSARFIIRNMQPLEYAENSTRKPITRLKVVIAWLVPVGAQSLGWLCLFRPYPSDDIVVYTRNFVAGISGVSLACADHFGWVPANSLPAYALVAFISWSGIFLLATSAVGRSLGWRIHFAMSIAWNLIGLFLYIAMCF
jgi:hypothetical protein